MLRPKLPHHATDRLTRLVIEKGNPVVVGIDPRRKSLPAGLRPASTAKPEAIAKAYSAFGRGVIDVVAEKVAAVKPQSAFFEELGPPGVTALAEVIAHAHRRKLFVVLDCKRGDIGSTAAAYANGLLGIGEGSSSAGDMMTVSPYLGGDSLEPFIEVSRTRGCGIFVLVKTSNPGGGLFQDLVCDGKRVYEHVAAHVERLASETVGESGYGLAGAVVGATYPDQLATLRAAMPHAWLLVPGYGDQGGGAADVAAAFDARGHGALINSSRGIIFAYHKSPYLNRFGERKWQDAVAAATDDMIADLAAETPAGKLQA